MIFKNIDTHDESLLSSIEIYNKIVKRKNKACRDILTENDEENSIYHIINERYKDYDLKKAELENISVSNFLDFQKKCLKGCYSIETDGLKSLLSLLESKKTNLVKSVCFYCGVGEPDTWDHYLPKEIFPEFSVYPNNLIPCCSTCNRMKWTNWIDEDTKYRKLVNFYFDRPSDVQILFVRLEKNKNTISVNLYLNDTYDRSDKILHIIYNHLKTLEIVERLTSKLNTYFDGKRKDYLFAKEEGILESWKKILENETYRLKKEYGVNYWKYAVNTAILNSNDFFPI